MKLCLATHPNVPNMSGNARGRTVHIYQHNSGRGFRSTFCGMKVTKFVTEESIKWTTFESKRCKNCADKRLKVIKKGKE